MLEYDFNELDNDFITIWSKYFLTNDITAIKDYIEALAELGQINAVQSWYLISRGKENKNIKAIVNSYNGGNFNEYLAMANYNLNENEISRKVNNIVDNLLDNSEFCGKTFKYALLEQIKYYKYFDKAIDKATQSYNTNLNALILERVAEMTYAFSRVWPIRSDCKKLQKQAFKLAMVARKSLNEQFGGFLDVSSDVSKCCQNNPQLAYALAKNYISYSKTEKEKGYGKTFLQELSTRELSKTLQEHLEVMKEKKAKDIAEKDKKERDYSASLVQQMIRDHAKDFAREAANYSGIKIYDCDEPEVKTQSLSEPQQISIEEVLNEKKEQSENY